MGAVLALLVVVVGDVKILVYIVHGVRDLAVQIHAVGPFQEGGGVQRIPYRFHVRGGEEPGFRAVLFQGVFQSVGLEELVVRIQAGIDDGHDASRAGAAPGPQQTASGHSPGEGHGGFIRSGLVQGLRDHVLYTGQGFDLLHGSEGHVGGDHVGCQSQVPDDVQRLAVQDLCSDPVGHVVLFRPDGIAVASGLHVFRDAFCGIAGLQNGRALQNDGHADDVLRGVGRLLLREDRLDQPGLGPDVDLCPGDPDPVGFLPVLLRGGKAGDRQSKDERRCQQHGQEAFPGVIHVHLSFGFLCLRLPPDMGLCVDFTFARQWKHNLYYEKFTPYTNGLQGPFSCGPPGSGKARDRPLPGTGPRFSVRPDRRIRLQNAPRPQGAKGILQYAALIPRSW